MPSTLTSEDRPRLRTQSQALKAIMADGRWHTLSDLREELRNCFGVYAAEAGISARIREARKPEFGSWIIDKTKISDGIWAYRMRANASQLTLADVPGVM